MMRLSLTAVWFVACSLLVGAGARAADLKPGLVGQYYALSGDPGDGGAPPKNGKLFFVRVDKQVNFPEASGEFYGSKLADQFMVRWSGVLRIDAAGAYTFATNSDDGSRLYIDGKLVVDNWGAHSMTKKSGSATLTAGDHEIVIAFNEGGGGAGCIATWTPPGKGEVPIPASALFHDETAAKVALSAWDEKAWAKIKSPPRGGGGGGDAGVAQSAAMGSVITTALHLGNDSHGPNIVYRAIIVRLDETGDACVTFDADTMRMAAGWTGGGLVLSGLPFTGGHGTFPSMQGDTVFTTHATPGWAASNGKLDDPRTGDYPPLGHLPKDWAHYKGLYHYKDRVVLKYTVGGATVLESPALVTSGEQKGLVREFAIDRDGKAMTLVLCDAPGDGVNVSASTATIPRSEGATLIGSDALPDGAKLATRDGLLLLDLPAASGKSTFRIIYATVVVNLDRSTDILRRLAQRDAAAPSLADMTRGGPALWRDVITVKGELATDKDVAEQAYVIDRITVPAGNKYEPRMRIGGMDFFSDGKRAAVSTWDGDVWIVSGIDDKLENLQWKRFATGLHEPLGLTIVDDVIYTVDDMQITRFHDLNGDGEADFYENFNNDWQLTSGFHAFCFDLHTDAAGNFYFAFGSPVRPGGGSFERIGAHHGSILKISKDGSKLERYATGLRAPNGMGVSPDGQITSCDNEGTFVPRCPIHWIKEGDFLGVVDSAAHRERFKTTPTVGELRGNRPQFLDPSEMPKPLAWLPKNIDNSGGGQAWVTSDKWGPFKGEMLHMSYGTSSLFLVLKENKHGQMQGGVVKFPLRFTSSCMRARFNPRDGQLYVAGLRGWQSNAAKEGGFDRVRYTGRTIYMPNALHIKPTGIEITFTQKLDPAAAGNVQNYSLRGADIKWTHGYGSSEFELGGRDGGRSKSGWTDLDIAGAKLLPDGQTVLLEVPDIQPAHEMEIRINIKAADGAAIQTQINNTVHEVE